MQAAHGKRLLHRDIKPANVLLRKDGGAWDVRIIDFGLALSQNLRNSIVSTRSMGKSITGGSIAGTIDYAAPEQMGKILDTRVGPSADVYGYGRTLNFALFGTPEATWHQYKTLPNPVAEFLSHCVQHKPTDRPQSFVEVLKMLDGLKPASSSAAAVPKPAAAELEDDRRSRGERPRRRDNDEREDRPRRREVDDERYEEDYARRRDPPVTTSTRILDAVLALFLGAFGIHKFSQGNGAAGVIRLLICLTCIGFYINMVIGWIEAVKYLVCSNKDYSRAYYTNKQGWF